jgi:hypothetical protein
MRSTLRIHGTSVILVLLLATACASPAAPVANPSAPTQPPAPTDAPATESIPTEETFIDFANQLEDFNPTNFDHPTQIDNPWLPMQPGARLVLEGITEEAGKQIPHRIVFTVTDLTKVINGVDTTVAYIVDFSENQPIEKEIAFYAQDNDGNVWYLGEYPEVYEGGKLVEAPAWIAGYKGAKAGIKMKANPETGAPSYSQGWGPAVNWTDRAQVAMLDQQTCVPADCYDGVLVAEEFSKEEPGAFQLKYYAPGVGNVRVGWRGADATRETLKLVEYEMLNPEALTQVRQEVLEIEQRAYQISKEVYDQTLPAQARE